jgi:hypothetical protein
MPLIDTTTLLKVADRAATQYQYINDAFDQLSQEGGAYYFDLVSLTDDPDVELPCDTNYEMVDQTLVSEGAPFAAAHGTRLAAIIGSMEAHFNRRDNAGNVLQAGGWDGYLYSHNQRVSWWFASLYLAVKSYMMLAVDVFSESNDVFATLEMNAGPTLQFTDGINYGNGSQLNPANGTYFAATQLKIVVVSFGANNLDIRLSVKDINNLPTTIDVTVPAGSTPGTVIPVGTASNRYLDVIGASLIPFSSYGTLGDEVTVNNLKERQISL